MIHCLLLNVVVIAALQHIMSVCRSLSPCRCGTMDESLPAKSKKRILIERSLGVNGGKVIWQVVSITFHGNYNGAHWALRAKHSPTLKNRKVLWPPYNERVLWGEKRKIGGGMSATISAWSSECNLIWIKFHTWRSGEAVEPAASSSSSSWGGLLLFYGWQPTLRRSCV